MSQPAMSAGLYFVAGGARSGKSAFAEDLAMSCGPNVAYLATGQVWDEEMADRVALHQKRRPASWSTTEVPLGGEGQILPLSRTVDGILFDCLTLFITNIMLAPDYQGLEKLVLRQLVLERVDDLIRAAVSAACPVIVVSNETGQGIVPDNALSREFRDLVGIANSRMAAAAQDAWFVMCGIPVALKELDWRQKNGWKAEDRQ